MCVFVISDGGDRLGYPRDVRIRNPMFSPPKDKLLLLHTSVIPKEQKREAPESLYAGKIF